VSLLRSRTFAVGVEVYKPSPMERVIRAAIRLRSERLHPSPPPPASVSAHDYERDLFDALDDLLMDELRHPKGVQYEAAAKGRARG